MCSLSPLVIFKQFCVSTSKVISSELHSWLFCLGFFLSLIKTTLYFPFRHSPLHLVNRRFSFFLVINVAFWMSSEILILHQKRSFVTEAYSERPSKSELFFLFDVLFLPLLQLCTSWSGPEYVLLSPFAKVELLQLISRVLSSLGFYLAWPLPLSVFSSSLFSFSYCSYLRQSLRGISFWKFMFWMHTVRFDAKACGWGFNNCVCLRAVGTSRDLVLVPSIGCTGVPPIDLW